MLSIAQSLPIYLCTAPTDMRKSFDGLCGLIESHGLGGASSDLLSGALFVFINRKRDRMKLLYFDGDGLAIWYKRLERGRFELPTGKVGRTQMSIDARQLRLILDGIDLASVKRRKRFALPTRMHNAVTDDRRALPDATRSTGR